MRLTLLLFVFLAAALTLDTGCMLRNRTNADTNDGPGAGDDNAGAEDDGKDVPGSEGDAGDDNADAGDDNADAGDDNADAGDDNADAGDDAGVNIRDEVGELRQGDDQLTSGEFADAYSVDVESGQSITVDMTSSTFDPYLILRAPGGDQWDNDDFNSDRTRSRIDHTASESGAYQVLATSYQPGESGEYRVSIHVGAGGGGGGNTPAGGGGGGGGGDDGK